MTDMNNLGHTSYEVDGPIAIITIDRADKANAVNQQTLIEESAPDDAAPAPAGRSTSKRIAAGDIVLVDKRGRRFHALVTELEQQESGRFELAVRPLDSRVTYRSATVREVVGVWRRSRSV